ncbi:MAG TPA: glycosyltransferase family 2 protein [Xanthomonadales bacterium]|nr:glycosyltransferase family 2 protein [Xanthomonadales bacterium]
MTRVSLVVPSKNRPAEIVRCLASVFAHSDSIAEIVVVDQSGTPYELAADPRVTHLYRPELGGLTAARNAGIDRATGDVVLFMDDDCTFESDVVSIVRDAFARAGDVVGVQPEIVDRDYAPPPISHRVFGHGFFDSHTFMAPGAAELRRMSGCAMAFRASVFANERFDESLHGYCYGEDWDFSLRAKRHGRLVLAPDARVEHRPSPNNRFDHRRALETRWTNFNYIYRKLRAQTSPLDRAWYLWWALGETLQWLRFGYGFPQKTRALSAR